MSGVIKGKWLRMEENGMAGRPKEKAKEKVILSHRLLGFERVFGDI